MAPTIKDTSQLFTSSPQYEPTILFQLCDNTACSWKVTYSLPGIDSCVSMICVLVLISAVPRLETFSTLVTQMTQTLNVSLHMIFHVSLCPHNFVADSAGKL